MKILTGSSSGIRVAGDPQLQFLQTSPFSFVLPQFPFIFFNFPFIESKSLYKKGRPWKSYSELKFLMSFDFLHVLPLSFMFPLFSSRFSSFFVYCPSWTLLQISNCPQMMTSSTGGGREEEVQFFIYKLSPKMSLKLFLFPSFSFLLPSVFLQFILFFLHFLFIIPGKFFRIRTMPEGWRHQKRGESSFFIFIVSTKDDVICEPSLTFSCSLMFFSSSFILTHFLPFFQVSKSLSSWESLEFFCFKNVTPWCHSLSH